MKFTRLRLQGFKSFVDPTVLDIEPGLTGIVGPNGCGKSNLVEALRWVMGETSAKSLRGSGMDDVIFAGTSGRPSRNMAEVALHIDNEARLAPPAVNSEDQLEITRRIERDSGSTYRINGRDMRARDVQLLFADLSSGAHSAALVRQGQIGQLINAKPQNRRMILEEAAGISGLHSRRHEAELRLKAAETNLTRLEDVLGELDTQLGALKKQARQAERYRGLSDKIRKAEAISLFLRWREATEAVLASEAEFRALEQEVARLAGDNANASKLQTEAAEALPALREAETAAAAALQRLTAERNALDQEEARAVDQARRLTAQLEQIDADIQREQAGLSDGEQELAGLVEEAQALLRAGEGHGDRLAEARAALDAQKSALTEAEEKLEAATRDSADFEARRSAARRRHQDLTGRRERLARDMEKVAADHEALEAEAGGGDLDRARIEAENAEKAHGEAENAATAAEQARIDAQAAEAAAREPIQEAERTLSALKAEAKTLATLCQSADGDIWPPILDAITVTPGFEKALGAALGDDLEVSADTDAPMHWAALPALESARPLPAEARPLSDVVDAPAVLARRLSQVGVVDDREGKALQAHLASGQRLVTRDGDLWRWDGLTVAADAPTPAAQRLEQRNRLRQVESDLKAAESAADTVRTAGETAKQAAAQAATKEREARTALRTAQQALSSARTRLAELEKKASRHQERLAGLTEAARRLAREAGDLDTDLTEAKAALDAVEAQPDPAIALGDHKERVGTLRLAVADAARACDGLEREEAARRDRLQAIEKTRSGWEGRKARAAEQLQSLAARRDEARTDLALVEAQPDAIAQKRSGLLEALEAAESRRRVTANQLQDAENRQREVDAAAKTLQAALSDARERRAGQDATLQAQKERVEDAQERIREAMDCTPEAVLETGGVEDGEDLPPLDEVDRRLERLKRERETMGAVNLRAEEEAAEYLERLETMNTEREDLLQAIGKLRQGIASLNKEGRDRLLAAFDVVNNHFTDLFTSLFGGGTAHLELVESDDPLNAGLEIFARPPGKKLSNLSLLSGGEQALTALSLIFAVFMANPAPICVLDEVDAPLDDANVERFCRLVHDIAGRTETRFLVITHHALTMSRMNRLYGVTMAERGVSQLVSVNLEEAERVVAAG
ncbi:MAG: chromosome segregation protein SMC [Alphaproteobacteria bacterium]